MELSRSAVHETVLDLNELRECVREEKKEIGGKSGFGVCVGCFYDLET